MDKRAQQLYASVADDRRLATALPRDAFVDASVFAAESSEVLKAGWLPVARCNALPNAGDYHCVDLLDVPLVVTRDSAGRLQVLSRVCRHRGMPVVEGTGNRQDFSCPYHLWRYDLQGKLLFAPAMDRFPAFDATRCNLPTVRHEEWGGWLFVNLSASAVPLAEQLAPLTARFGNVDTAQLVTATTLDFDSPWNWKVMVENFLESYHHIGPHANTLQPYNPAFGTYATEHFGNFTILENPPSAPGGNGFVVACIFPLTLISITESDVPWAVWYEFLNVKHDGFQLRIHLLMTPEQAAIEALVTSTAALVRAIHIEDIVVCAGVQTGLRSPLYESGPLSDLEGCLWHFHRYLQRCFSGASRG